MIPKSNQWLSVQYDYKLFFIITWHVITSGLADTNNMGYHKDFNTALQ